MSSVAPRFSPLRPESGLLASLPLLVAYVLLPLAGAGMRLVRWESFFSPPPLGVAVWTLLAGAALLWAVWERISTESPEPQSFGLLMPLGVALTAGLVLGGLWAWSEPRAEQAERWLRWLAEGGPLIYLLLAAAWGVCHGLPSRRVFVRLGGLLGLMVLLDLGQLIVLEGFRTGLLGGALSGGWLAGGGMFGDQREAMACLLGVALFASIRERGEARGELPASRLPALVDKASFALIVLGLAATFSRTALFAAACGWVFLGRGGRLSRAVLAAFLLAAAAFALAATPLPTADTARLTGPLLWMAGVERFVQAPEALLTARGLGPFALTPPLSTAMALGIPLKVQFLEPAQITSLWLRLALVWGAFGLGAFVLLLLIPSVLRPTRMGSGIVALVLAQGTVFSLFYDPRVSVVLWLGLLAALASHEAMAQAAKPERETASSESEFTLE